MTEAEYSSYRESGCRNYALSKAKEEKIPMAEATRLAEESFSNLLPEGVQTPFQFLFVIENKQQQPVGHIWFGRKTNFDAHYAWIYDIEVYPEFRGKGFGRGAMIAIEEEIKKVGLDSIGLHVFGTNRNARQLYQEMGFQETNVVMRKDL